MFEIKYSNQSNKFLKKANKVLLERLIKKIEEIRKQPVMHDTKTVEGYEEKLFGFRVGDYRILYEVNYEFNEIGIVKIDKRSKVYE